MKACVFEDRDEKFDVIRDALLEQGFASKNVIRVRFVSDFSEYSAIRFNVYIVDLWMPYVKGGKAENVGLEILRSIGRVDGFSAEVLIVTEYMAQSDEAMRAFAGKGCVTTDFRDQKVWKSALNTLVQKAKDRERYDFIVVAALEDEWSVYRELSTKPDRLVNRHNLKIMEIWLGDYFGAVVCLPRMGLVNATAVTSRMLENYSPKVACMSGICGGLGNAELGQLLVTDVCWEYQSGKWADDGFKHEAYQAPISETIRSCLSVMLSSPDLLEELECDVGVVHRPKNVSAPKLAIFASGSAVIARSEYLDQVKEQHRQVTGIDMELFGFHRAVQMFDMRDLTVFSAKVVVDKANAEKNDDLHPYGCKLSALFCKKVLIEQLKLLR